MPRYEKSGRSKEYFFEIVLDVYRVYVAKGVREKGKKQWRIGERDRYFMAFRWEREKARPYYDEQIAAILKQGYQLVGNVTKEADKFRRSCEKDIGKVDTPPPKSDIAHHELLVKSGGKVSWTSAKYPDETWQIEVVGDTVTIKQGKTGRRPRTKKETYVNHEEAMWMAAGSMTIAKNILGFGK